MDDIGRQAISKEELYTAAVGERAARYYVPKFLAFEEGTKRFSFNVWALLFGAFWFCYRRMWISALVLWIGGTWLVGVLTSTTLLALGLSQLTTPIISIVSALYVRVILPVFANYLYYSSVGQRIAHLREKFVDDADALSALKSRSPVSWLALAVLALLVVGGRLLQPSLSRNQASESYVRAAMEQTTTLRTAVVKSYLSRHVWPEDLKDLSPQGEVLLSRQDAENLRIDLGTITIRFTTLDGLRGGLLSFRPSLASSGAVVWTCGYHTPAGVDVRKAGAGPDLTNIAPKYLPPECKKHFWDWN
jgi:Protein of unknown function (DUF2628)/Pilin (bacterial filament)